MSLCQCGCGKPAPIAKMTSAKHGRVKGQPCRFAYGHTGRKAVKSYKQQDDASTHVHRARAARVLGRPLPVGSEVHHVDEDITNPSARLVICQDKAYHKLLHVRTRIVRAGGNPNTERICSKCRRVLPLSAFNRRTANVNAGRQAACRECMDEYRRDLQKVAAW